MNPFHKTWELEDALAACKELLHIREAEITQLDLELTTAKRTVVEADAAFNRDGKELPYDEACLGLVRMCHEGRAALEEPKQSIYCPSCGEWFDTITFLPHPQAVAQTAKTASGETNRTVTVSETVASITDE